MMSFLPFLLLFTPAPESGPTDEWRFINYHEVLSEQDLKLNCDFRDMQGELFRVEIVQHGEISYYRGGFDAWPGTDDLPSYLYKGDGDLPEGATRYSDVFGTISRRNEVLRDDTGYFAGADFPRVDDWETLVTSVDGSAKFFFSLGPDRYTAGARIRGKHSPASIYAIEVPPPVQTTSSVTSSPPFDGAADLSSNEIEAKVSDIGSLAGFCSLARESKTLPFELLDRFGKENP